jgi:hypothetical protein
LFRGRPFGYIEDQYYQEAAMGELVAWGLGIALGFTAKDLLTSSSRILAFALSIIVLGALITLFSGEMESEPWLVIVDIGQVAGAALIGAFALPFALRRLRGTSRSASP